MNSSKILVIEVDEHSLTHIVRTKRNYYWWWKNAQRQTKRHCPCQSSDTFQLGLFLKGILLVNNLHYPMLSIFINVVYSLDSIWAMQFSFLFCVIIMLAFIWANQTSLPKRLWQDELKKHLVVALQKPGVLFCGINLGFQFWHFNL